ncbi:MAG: hypothetical protein FWD09_01260 [Lentimicrobiaceae bacterium]|nr:hypothetical protein [Lentimicrobiaceae bacterium]
MNYQRYEKAISLLTSNITKKKPNSLKTTLTLIIIFALTMIELSAKDKIVFNWYAETSRKSIQMRATKDKTFTVNWGDGIIETKVDANHSYAFFLEHKYSSNGYYEVTKKGGEAVISA